MTEISGELQPSSYVDTCEACGAWTRLRSYDAKQIVRVGLPIKRGSTVHVIDRCDVCGSARSVDEATWSLLVAEVQAKANQVDEASEQEAAELLAQLAEIRDRERFLPVAHSLSARFSDSLVVGRALIHAYDRFDMAVAAERAALKVVELEDTPEARRALARVYLRQHKPAEAEAHLAGQEDTREGSAHLILVAELFATLGATDNAREVLSRLDQSDPAVTETQILVDQNLAGAPLHHVRYLPTPAERRPYELPKAAANPGCLWIVGLVLVVPFVAMIALGLALAKESVVFVNATSAPYTIEIDGEPRQLRPGRTTIELDDDEHQITAFAGTERAFTFPLHVEMMGEYKKKIVNPDRSAVFVYEESEYRIVNTPKDHYLKEYISGELVYDFEADFFFIGYPGTIDMYEDSEIRTRISLEKGNWIPVIDKMVAKDGLEHALDVLRARLNADPDDPALAELVYRTPPNGKDDLRAFLQTRLDDEPARIAWHRAYLKTGYDAKEAYAARPEPSDTCLLALRATVTKDPSERRALFARSTADDDACDVALHEHARFLAKAGETRAASALLKRAKPEPADTLARDQAHLLLGKGRVVVRERTAEAERNAVQVRYDIIEGRRRAAARKANGFFDVIEKPGKVPANVVNDYRAWSGYVQRSVDVGLYNKARLTKLAESDVDLLFSERLIEGKLKEAAAGLWDGTVEAHLLIAAHALRKKDKATAEQQLSLAVFKWNSPAAQILTQKKPPSLAQARAAGLELELPRALFAYLGAKHKRKARTFYKEADRLLTDVSWSSLAVRGLPYKWRQGRVR